MHVVSQPAGQPGESLSSKISIAATAQEVADGVHMKHSGGDIGVSRAGEVRLALSIEPRGAAQRMREVPTEIEQSITFGGERRIGDPRVR
jgi:hypothetical protein